MKRLSDNNFPSFIRDTDARRQATSQSANHAQPAASQASQPSKQLSAKQTTKFFAFFYALS
jgi:hypothetical protein